MDKSTEQLGANLVGVIKAVARDVVYERDKAEEVVSRRGEKWVPEEEDQLLAEYECFLTIAALIHKRNVNGIKARLKIVLQTPHSL